MADEQIIDLQALVNRITFSKIVVARPKKSPREKIELQIAETEEKRDQLDAELRTLRAKLRDLP